MDKKKIIRSLPVLFLILIMIAVGIKLFPKGIPLLLWDEGIGTVYQIEKIEYDEEYLRRLDKTSVRGGSSNTLARHLMRTDIHYSYQYQGGEYTGKIEQGKYNTYEVYPSMVSEGSTIDIVVNPKDPSASVYNNPGFHDLKVLFWIFLVSLLACIGYVIGLIYRKDGKYLV